MTATQPIDAGTAGPGWWWRHGATPPPSTFHQFVLKVTNRCNLNCTYCYVFNLEDQTWRAKPARMSRAVLAAAAASIGDYVRDRRPGRVSVVLHGGEPLLLGHDRLAEAAEVITAALGPLVPFGIGIQTNGILLDDRFIALARQHRFDFGLSMDGPPTATDRNRVDHHGAGSGQEVERGLLRLCASRDVFSGVLCVVDLANDPDEVYDYFKARQVPRLDFLLPEATHDRLPPGVSRPEETGRYADWLLTVFHRWYAEPGPRIPIRLFESVMRRLLGQMASCDAVGLLPNVNIVVESDGTIEGPDSLKSCYNGAPHTGLSVFEHPLRAAEDVACIRARNAGLNGLADRCLACPLVSVCSGGYFPHRYKSGSGFLNPSIYCHALQALIPGIAARMLRDFEAGGVRASDFLRQTADHPPPPRPPGVSLPVVDAAPRARRPDR